MKTIKFIRVHNHAGKSYQLKEIANLEDATADKLVSKGFAEYYNEIKVKKVVVMDEVPLTTEIPVDETVVLAKVSEGQQSKEEKTFPFNFEKKKDKKQRKKGLVDPIKGGL